MWACGPRIVQQESLIHKGTQDAGDVSAGRQITDYFGKPLVENEKWRIKLDAQGKKREQGVVS